MTLKTSNILLLALIPVLLAMTFFVETIMPEVTVTTIPSGILSDFFAGRVVAHITDLHVVKYGWREQLTLSSLRKIEPDIIFMTGDYLETYSNPDDLERYMIELGRIAPVIATPGNNDYCCIRQLDSVFLRAGVTFLKNETLVLNNGADSLYIVGLEDNFLWHDDYFTAARPVPAGAPRIVLGHAPAIAEKIDPDGIELVLAGHLHGGQIMIPFCGPLAPNDVCFVSQFYAEGLYSVNGINLFPNRGLGTSILPVRFLSRPQIALLEFSE